MADRLSTREAAELLGWSVDRVRKNGSRLGGSKSPSGRWSFPVDAIGSGRQVADPALGTRRRTAQKNDAKHSGRAGSPRRSHSSRRKRPAGPGILAWIIWGQAAVVALLLVVGALGSLFAPGESPPPPRPRPTFSLPPAPSPTPHARCRDGTLSYSVNRQGTCSWHGGVGVWLR